MFTDIGLMKNNFDVIDPSCEGSLESQIEYMGKSHILLLVDNVRFHPQYFGEDKLEKTSMIIN